MSRNTFKHSRQDRRTLIAQQEQLIEARRREIEERLKGDQKFDQKPTDIDDSPEPEENIKTEKAEQIESFVNRFKNDGSFLEMFKKMPGSSKNSSYQSSPPSFSKPEENETKKEDRSPKDNMRESGPNVTVVKKEPSECKEDDEIRLAIEKGAIYVAMNGVKTEASLQEEFINQAEYSWVHNESDVNHQYFRRRVEELRSAIKRAAEESSSQPTSDGPSTSISDLPNEANHIKKKRPSRWGEDPQDEKPLTNISRDSELVKYAMKVYGKLDLSADQWKQLEDQRKMKILFEMLEQKRKKKERLKNAGKFTHEYDSDEEIDGGTWEHKNRGKEMEKTREWAQLLTERNHGKHHIGDFLPPSQLEKFMKKWESIKDGSTSLLYEEEYKDFKLNSQNTGFKMLQKLGWSEGQGLGANETGITEPVTSEGSGFDRAGLGAARPDELTPTDDEYEAYRKRMMLAYRFRPNPLNNPRRPYY